MSSSNAFTDITITQLTHVNSSMDAGDCFLQSKCTPLSYKDGSVVTNRCHTAM